MMAGPSGTGKTQVRASQLDAGCSRQQAPFHGCRALGQRDTLASGMTRVNVAVVTDTPVQTQSRKYSERSELASPKLIPSPYLLPCGADGHGHAKNAEPGRVDVPVHQLQLLHDFCRSPSEYAAGTEKLELRYPVTQLRKHTSLQYMASADGSTVGGVKCSGLEMVPPHRFRTDLAQP